MAETCELVGIVIDEVLLVAEEAKWDASFEATDQTKLQAFIDASLAEGDAIGISDDGDELTPVYWRLIK